VKGIYENLQRIKHVVTSKEFTKTYNHINPLTPELILSAQRFMPGFYWGF
jgi:hypothetical protein